MQIALLLPLLPPLLLLQIPPLLPPQLVRHATAAAPHRAPADAGLTLWVAPRAASDAEEQVDNDPAPLVCPADDERNEMCAQYYAPPSPHHAVSSSLPHEPCGRAPAVLPCGVVASLLLWVLLSARSICVNSHASELHYRCYHACAAVMWNLAPAAEAHACHRISTLAADCLSHCVSWTHSSARCTPVDWTGRAL
jgi:hypothetical protein